MRSTGFLGGLVLTLCLCGRAGADVAGTVQSLEGGAPVAGARVHVQGQAEPFAVTDAQGRFQLVVPVDVTDVVVAAGLPYARSAAANYATGAVDATNGDGDLLIELQPIPSEENPDYTPLQARVPGGCGDCHAPQYDDWSTSAHSLAAVDPWVLDVYSGTGTPGTGGNGYVYRTSHPGQTGYCATCHAPAAEAHAPGSAYLDEIEGNSADEGVNCSACHTIDSVSSDPNDLQKLHTLVQDGKPKSTQRFPAFGFGSWRTSEFVWGPMDDVRYPFMQASYGAHFKESLLCASCHEYSNPTTGAPGQQTYTEWKASAYAVEGDGYRTCQDCHMVSRDEDGRNCEPPPLVDVFPVRRPAAQRHVHTFLGSTPERLQGAIRLEAGASATPSDLTVRAEVRNQGAGHSFPTGVDIRNALLVVSATLDGQPLTQLEGPTVPTWADDGVPGVQPGDYAGQPGKGFAKILEGRVNGQGEVVSPVLFIDAERVQSDTLIPSGTTDASAYRFELPSGTPAGQRVHVTARLIYRRAFRALAVAKGWVTTPQGGPIEIEVGASELDVTVPELVPAAGRSAWLIALCVLGAYASIVLRAGGGPPSGRRSPGRGRKFSA